MSSILSALIGPNEPDDYQPWEEQEKLSEGEEDKITRLIDITRRMQERNMASHAGRAFRVTHVKLQAFVKGTLTVSLSLPPYFQHGLFSTPGKSYDIAARYANEPVHIQDDKERGPRGLGMKVFGVDTSSRTMDLLFNNAPMLELTDLDTCLEIFELRERYWEDPEGLKVELKKRKDTSKQMAPTQLPNTHIMGQTMFTQSAFRYGPYICHLSLVPTHPAQIKLSSTELPSDAAPDAHRNLLATHFATSNTSYSLRAQFATSTSSHPVEDASVVWEQNNSAVARDWARSIRFAR